MLLLLPLVLSMTITALISFWFLRYCKGLAKYKNASFNVSIDSSYQPTVSIIIPTYNEASSIKDKIENAIELNYPPEKVKIIVIDSASTDGTADIAERFESVKVIRQPERKGKSSALAEVFKVATEEIVVITDADAMLDKDVLKNAMPYFADKSVGAVTGKQILINPNETISQQSEQTYREFFDTIRTIESKIASTMIFNGPFMAFRQNVLEAPPQNSVADDTEMAIHVIKKGYRALYIPEAIFYEKIPLSNESRIKQKERRAQGLVQSFWRHRDILFNTKYGKFGTDVFPSEFAVHLLLPFALMISIIVFSISLYIDMTSSLIITSIYLFAVGIYTLAVYSDINKIVNSSNKDANIKDIMITFLSFMQLQFALLSGALKMVIFGTSHIWEQISDIREN